MSKRKIELYDEDVETLKVLKKELGVISLAEAVNHITRVSEEFKKSSLFKKIKR